MIKNNFCLPNMFAMKFLDIIVIAIQFKIDPFYLYLMLLVYHVPSYQGYL